MDDTSGIVYVLSNEGMPGLLKIGMTQREDAAQRMNELYTTSVPFQFNCVYACRVDDCKKVEEALHVAFSTDRVNPKREFFRMSSERVLAILKLFEKENVTDTLSTDLQKNLSTEEQEAEKKSRLRRPPLNFEEMGISKGDRLTMFYEDKEYVVEVCDIHKVKFNGEEYSLTGITKKIRNINYAIQPTRFWNYNGRNLSEIYDETYSISED